MSKVSNHISLKEACRSNTADRAGIENKPTDFQLSNMKLVAENCFEPLRMHHGKPIYISSFLRSLELNKITPGGSKTSQHLQGELTGVEEGAIDIDMDVYDNGMTNAEAFHWLRNNVEYDQIIWEYGTDENPNWVHISFRKGANRKMALRKRAGKKYELFD